MTEPADRAMLATVSALLTQGHIFDGLSRLMTAGALFGLLAHAVINDADPVLVTVALSVAALAGLAQTYFAARVGFDAALFGQLGTGIADLATLDAVLERLGLLPAGKTGRPLDARIAGARSMLRMQLLALIVQIAAVLGAALIIVLT